MCIECRQTPCHPRCPNYIPKKTNCYCSICREEILIDEKYVVNDDGDYAHFECFYNLKHLLEWLGYKIKTMEENE